jgi:hypothetical protein
MLRLRFEIPNTSLSTDGWLCQESGHEGQKRVAKAGVGRVGLRLGSFKGDKQGLKALLELAALSGQWDVFLTGSTRAEILTDFIEGGTETGGTSKRPKAACIVL